MVDAAVRFADTPAIDAFGRGRFSQPSTVFDSKLINGKNTDAWDEIVSNVSGDASATFDTNRVVMSVGADAGDYVIRQTKMRFNYLPGKSQLVFQTFVMGHSGNTTRRCGSFNSTYVAPYDQGLDGIWLEHDGTTAYWCIGQGGTVERVPQSRWNKDTLARDNRPDRHAFIADWDKCLIAWMDYEWLGVGRVRVGFVHNGKFVVCHEFNHDNSTVVPYMNTPNHSIRYEIRSNGGAGELVAICSSVQSEGGSDAPGALYSASRGTTAFTTLNNSSVYPVLSLRLDAAKPDGTIIVTAGSMFCTTAAEYLWTLRLNPTIAGVDAASFTSIGGNSSAQFDIARTTANTVTGGTVIASGYGADTNQSIGNLRLDLSSAVRPGVSIDGTPDELVLCVQLVAPTGAESFYGSLTWREPQ